MGTNLIFSSTLKKPEASYLLQKKTTIIISVFIFFMCLFVGIFISLCLDAPDRTFLSEPLLRALTSNNEKATPYLTTNYILLFLIFISGLSVYGFPASFFILAGKAVALGFTYGIIFSSLSGHDTKAFLFSAILPNMLILITFVLAVSVSANYALLHITNRHSGSDELSLYILSFIIFSIAILVASVIEVNLSL